MPETAPRVSMPDAPFRQSMPETPPRVSMPEVSSRPSTPETRSEAVEWLRAWTRRQCGIAFADEQSGMFEVRLDSLCRELKVPIEQIQTGVEQGDHALTLRLAETVSTNYTFFFREPEMFDYLRERVFPSLRKGATVRIWSAASSSGEEAYSLAILAQECLGPDAARVRILGTDISERQLKLAERGVYRREQLGPISGSRLARWFLPAEGGQLRVRDELRGMCMFRRLNLLRRPWPFEQKFQIIFLRNVLYYFEPATRRDVLEACYDAVEPNGHLITSLTEPMGEFATRWHSLGPAIFRRGAL